MLRTEHLVESVSGTLALTEAQARALSKIGTRLASDRLWWGAGVKQVERSIIRCTPASQGTWTVRVQDAVGLISLGELQIVVAPKIPEKHLLFLFARALQIPRLDQQEGAAASAMTLWDLVARWFIRSAQSVLRRDLARDYVFAPDVLQAVRGRVENMPTARAYYSGRLALHCTIDDFVVDTPLNRMLKAAAREINRSRVLEPSVRNDARKLMARIEDVGPLQPSDRVAEVDRPTWYYREALVLARHILRFVGRSISPGDLAAWTFLIRTPELVEAGVRDLLREALAPLAVEKRAKRVGVSSLTINPDVVFGTNRALADVKYKVFDGSWNRPDLYEAVAFATGFGIQRASLIGFAGASTAREDLTIGNVSLSRFCWSWAKTPESAAEELCSSIRDWLSDGLTETPC